MTIKKIFDLIFSLIIFILISPIIIILVCYLFFNNIKNNLFFKKNQERIIFLMPKFRTMLEDTPQVATHLLQIQINIIQIWEEFE